MNILHTVLYTFPKVLARRICLTIKSFFFFVIISLILVTLMFDPGGYCKEKLDVSHSQGLKEGGGVSPTSWTSFTLVQPDNNFFLIII